MPPVLKELKGMMQDAITILKIDVDKNPHVAQAFQIQGVPTLIIFKDGEIKWRQAGVASAKQLQEVLQQLPDNVPR
jgi:thioredoxin